MPIPNSLTLRQAYKIASKIEGLKEKLHSLLGDTLELPPKPIFDQQASGVDPAPRRRGRPPGSVRKQGANVTGIPSKIAGRPRPASPSGPLAPAVVKVLQRYGRAMKVTEILIGLEHDNYVWTAKNPRQTLYIRIGKLAGVKRAGEGLYIAEHVESAYVGITPETIAPSFGEQPIHPFQPESTQNPETGGGQVW